MVSRIFSIGSNRRLLHKNVLHEEWKEKVRRRDWSDIDTKIRRRCEIMEAILSHTQISIDHMTPRIKLFLLTPQCSLYRGDFEQEKEKLSVVERKTFDDPFWSIYWPGGQGLARFILEAGEELFEESARENERKVLDLGAGCGASAIAVKHLGLSKVLANDINEVACIATLMNATLNNVDLQVSWKNLLEDSIQEFYDVIFVGDMLYDQNMAQTLIPWLVNACKMGTRVYLGDPGRHALNNELKKNLKLLQRYTLPESVRRENNGYNEVNVWQLQCHGN